MNANGFAYDTAGFCGWVGSANKTASAFVGSVSVRISRGAVAPPLRIYPLYLFLIKLGNLN